MSENKKAVSFAEWPRTVTVTPLRHQIKRRNSTPPIRLHHSTRTSAASSKLPTGSPSLLWSGRIRKDEEGEALNSKVRADQLERIMLLEEPLAPTSGHVHSSLSLNVVLPCQESDHRIDHSSDSDSDAPSRLPMLASGTLGLALPVRMFGGVIVGTAAEEICRTWGAWPVSSAQEDARECCPSEDHHAKSVVTSFAIPATVSSGHLSGEADCDAVSSGGRAPDSGHDTEETDCGALLKRPGGNHKRKFGEVDSSCASFVSECALPTDKGIFRLRAYRYTDKIKSHEPVVMVAGDVQGRSKVPVRVHDQCQTSEVLGSKRCDCREQLDASLKYIQEKGGGAVIYLAQEGRGIGLANKVAAYALQDGGLDTVDANRRLGFKDDQRSYECVDFILKDMGVKSIQLMTNNPFKTESLRALGVNVEGRIPIQMTPNMHNHAYLEAKVSRMGHLINTL